MAGCAAIGGCDNSVANGGLGCHLCDVIAKMPQPTGHDTDRKKNDRADFRESKTLEDLSGPRAAALSLGRKKRHREGPFRQQRG